MSNLAIALAQFSSATGNPAANAATVIEAARQAHAHGASLLITAQYALCGYPTDLMLRADFLAEQQTALGSLAEQLAQWPDLRVLLGHVHHTGDKLYSAMSLLEGGRLVATAYKNTLEPDEHRYFCAGTEPGTFELDGVVFGIAPGDDASRPAVVNALRARGATVLINPQARAFAIGSHRQILDELREQAAGFCAIYLNQVGGHDERVFDGGAFVLEPDGQLAAHMPLFTDALQLLVLKHDTPLGTASIAAVRQLPCSWHESGNTAIVAGFDSSVLSLDAPAATGDTIWPAWPDDVEQVYLALTLALRDYVGQAGFPGVILGLSGGLDSALVLAIAVDALGPERVHTLMMPSVYTADISLHDAKQMADGLGVSYSVVPIDEAMALYDRLLQPHFQGKAADTTEENLQARIRGNVLMALSNKHGYLLLNTSNKSETATGYSTLYGDMAGGFALLKDVPKTWVYKLARWRNRLSPAIPQRIIDRPPSAELRAGQTDQDSLPPYEVLDGIISRYVDGNQTAAQIVAAGFDPAVVARIARLIRLSEYKRRQGAIGPKITARAFGLDWRFPVVNGFTDPL